MTVSKFVTILVFLLLSFSPYSMNANEKQPESNKMVYFTLSPEIVTNYITKGTTLGFINIKIDLMLNNIALSKIVEYHQPLIRDTIITVISKESERSIKSPAGREALRKACLEEVNQVLLNEIDNDENIVTDLLFTKYLYQ